ncbi:MAG: T9SS type A sorting domain-containing protein [Saprospiraceae bacterium]|nr:T9SS type A sorting domain-containing protein [Saprospiraceae bacterium]
MEKLIILLFLIVCNQSFSQILNNSFEDWIYDPKAFIDTQKWALKHWIHCDKRGNPDSLKYGTYRNPNAQSGKYALSLSRWYNYSFDVVKYKNSIKSKPTFLQGFYKFSENRLGSGILDTAEISIYLTKFNTVSKLIDTIALAICDLPPTPYFTIFNCKINYKRLALIPDSIIVYIKPSKFENTGGGCANEPWCSYLNIDNLMLEYGNLNQDSIEQKYYKISPNPSSGQFTIIGKTSNKRISIYTLLGNLVYDQFIDEDHIKITMKDLKHGLYFLRINGKPFKLYIK